MPTNYDLLLSDLNATRIYLWEVTYKTTGGGAPTVLRISSAPQPAYQNWPYPFEARVLSPLNVSMSIIQDGRLGGFAGIEAGVLEWHNLDGVFDSWQTGVTIDGLSIRCLLVGALADGTVVTYSEAAAQPLFSGVGIGRPKVNPKQVTVGLRGSLGNYSRPLNKHDFNPPCPKFPGTSSGYIDFGNVLNHISSFSMEFWIYCNDPTVGGQIVWSKDTGAAGQYVDVGTGGSGVLRFGIREQTPAFSDTPAATIQPLRWHHVAVQWDASQSKRFIYVDRVLVTTTSSVSGSPATNSAHFKVGPSFAGLISYGRSWSTVRTLSQISDNMLFPLLGTETGLEADLRMEEGIGGTTADKKPGSSISGSLGAGVTWSSSGWCGSSLVGKKWSAVLGRALDVQLSPNDPARSIYGAAYRPVLAISAVRSSHVAMTPSTQYSTDLSRGLVTLVSAAGGKLSADIVGETNFNAAVQFDGSTGYASSTVTCPAGAMSLSAMVMMTANATATQRIACWSAGGGAGARSLSIGAGGTNVVRLSLRNDAGTVFTVDPVAPLVPNRRYVLVGVLDTAASQGRLYVDGTLAGTVSLSGTFATTVTAFTCGRNSTSATEFLAGVVDEVTVWNKALTLSDAEALTALPVAGTEANLTQAWHFDENSGTSVANAVSGGPALTLNGATTWTWSRIAAADLLAVIHLRYAGYSRSTIDVASMASFIRASAADCQCVVDDDSSCQEVAQRILQGLTSYARPALGSDLLQVGQVALPTGTPNAGDYGSRDTYYEQIDDANDSITSEYYGVRVLHSRNYNPMPMEQLVSIVTTQTARFQFALEEWRSSPVVQDLTILDDFPNATILDIESPLLSEADATAEAIRVFPLIQPGRLARVLPFRTSALAVTPGNELRVTYESHEIPPVPRLGMGAPGMSFTILQVTRTAGTDGVTVSVIGLA